MLALYHRECQLASIKSQHMGISIHIFQPIVPRRATSQQYILRKSDCDNSLRINNALDSYKDIDVL